MRLSDSDAPLTRDDVDDGDPSEAARRNMKHVRKQIGHWNV